MFLSWFEPTSVELHPDLRPFDGRSINWATAPQQSYIHSMWILVAFRPQGPGFISNNVEYFWEIAILNLFKVSKFRKKTRCLAVLSRTITGLYVISKVYWQTWWITHTLEITKNESAIVNKGETKLNFLQTMIRWWSWEREKQTLGTSKQQEKNVFLAT